MSTKYLHACSSCMNTDIFSGKQILEYSTYYSDRTYQFTLSNPRLNHNSTQPQPKITLVGFDMKMTLHPHPPLTTQTQCQQYLSCYQPDFDETLSVDSWEHLEQIPIVKATFVLATLHLSILGISQLLLTQF